MMRVLTNTKICDKVPTNKLLEDTGMLSTNQLNAQIKLLEMWKANNVKDYPLKLNKQSMKPNNVNTRACTQGQIIEEGSTSHMVKSCIGDATRLWNKAPASIT